MFMGFLNVILLFVNWVVLYMLFRFFVFLVMNYIGYKNLFFFKFFVRIK